MGVFIQEMAVVDPDALDASCSFIKKSLAENLRAEFQKVLPLADQIAFQDLRFVLALAGIRRLVVQIKAIGKHDLIPL